MSVFTKATPAQPIRTPDAEKMIYAYILVLIAFILCQLFTFDDFSRLIESFWLPGGIVTAHLLGSFIIVCELFALPFLLRMKLSPLMRIVSMVLGWSVALIWFAITIWLNLTVNAVSNVGFLGTVVRAMPGWWAVCASIILGLMAAWSSWGLWPGKRK